RRFKHGERSVRSSALAGRADRAGRDRWVGCVWCAHPGSPRLIGGRLIMAMTPSQIPTQHTRQERVRAFAEKHWLGVGATPEQKIAIDEIRRQYLITAQEYDRAANTLYDALGMDPQKLAARKVRYMLGNRNVQLFLAYSILWEAFNHIYTAAACSDFARNGPD